MPPVVVLVGAAEGAAATGAGAGSDASDEWVPVVQPAVSGEAGT